MTLNPSSSVLTCPACGKQFALSPEYIAQYGGMDTPCPCGATMRIPAATAVGAIPPPLPTHPGMPVIQYATPSAYQSPPGFGVWREGNLLVVRQGAPLPDACIKCGGPVSGRPLRKTYFWHEPWIYILILTGLLLYAIVALICRKTARVEIPLCATHRTRRRNFILAGWLMALGGIGLIVLLCMNDNPAAGVGFGILTMLAGLITGAVGARILTPRKIDPYYAWFKGAGPQFLDALPSV